MCAKDMLLGIDRKKEAVVFAVHMIKMMDYGFHRLNEIEAEGKIQHGSASMAFYLVNVYNLISSMFLLDRAGAPRGGMFFKVFGELGMEGALDPVWKALDRLLGSSTFGEVIRQFRNKAMIHGTLSDKDMDKVTKLADLTDPATYRSHIESMDELRAALMETTLLLCEAAEVDPKDVGVRQAS